MARRTKKKETLTTACASLLKVLEKDLRAAVEDDEPAQARWKAEWSEAKKAGRTGKTFQAWLDGELTQVGASWILSCVFVRFVEDNGLIEMPVLSGPIATGDEPSGWQSARDAEAYYYGEHPTHAEVEYLEHVFRELGRSPDMADLFDARHAAGYARRRSRVRAGGCPQRRRGPRSRARPRAASPRRSRRAPAPSSIPPAAATSSMTSTASMIG